MNKKLIFFPILFCLVIMAFGQGATDAKTQSFWYQYNMPWIATLAISIITITINLWISKTGFKESRANLRLQVSAALSSNNRQKWIDELRITVGEVSANAKMLNIEFQDPAVNLDRKKTLMEKLSLSKNKLLLLLDPEKELHMKVITALEALLNVLDGHLFLHPTFDKERFNNADYMNSDKELIIATRNLLYAEWKKIQAISESTNERKK